MRIALGQPISSCRLSPGRAGLLEGDAGSRVVSLRETEGLHCGSSLWESVFFEPVNLESWSLMGVARGSGPGHWDRDGK